MSGYFESVRQRIENMHTLREQEAEEVEADEVGSYAFYGREPQGGLNRFSLDSPREDPGNLARRYGRW